MVVKTSGNKGVKRRKRYGIGKQALLPVKQVITDHRADAAFIYAGTVFHDSGKVTAASACSAIFAWNGAGIWE